MELVIGFGLGVIIGASFGAAAMSIVITSRDED